MLFGYDEYNDGKIVKMHEIKLMVEGAIHGRDLIICLSLGGLEDHVISRKASWSLRHLA